MSLQNKIVVVTGGATGIGFALAQSFSEKGAQVVIGSRRQSAIDEAIQKSGGKLHGKAVDVGNRTDVNQFMTWVESTYGKVDVLVNAAGVNIKDRTMAAMLPEQWDQVMQINATGAYNCIHAVLPGMKTRKSGFIVNISSVTGKRAIALGGVAYAASKFAMTALGTCVANEVGGEGIRVTNVYPGEVDTPILDHRPVPVTEAHRQSILRPEDIAQVVVALVDTPARVHVPEIVIKPVHQSYY
jgi:NADP-dependent 3-hydroxy acid dehydrogenase YdfG